MAKKRIKKSKKNQGIQPTTWSERKPVLRFAGLFLLSCIIFYAISGMEWFDVIRSPLLKFFATASAGVLFIFNSDVSAQGETLSSPKFAVEIREGCDAIAPTILYCLSVLFYPVSWSRRWKGIGIGILALMILNIIRIVSLYLTGVYAPSWFEFMHVDFWQVAFILSTVLLWIYWMRWAVGAKITIES
jgi:exosortase H (IPTLxxWG-CTERM-specific)